MRIITFVLVLTVSFSSILLNGQCLTGNCANGNGAFKNRDGSKYVGSFKAGKFSGKGQMVYPNGDVYVGNFAYGYKSGNGRFDYGDGSTYTGAFLNNVREGFGTITFKSGDIYKGDWKNDHPGGFGEYRFANGNHYLGGFKQGKFYGKGTYTKMDGTEMAGIWENNKLIKPIPTKQDVVVEEPKKEAISSSISTPKKEVKTELPNCNKTHCDRIQGKFTYNDGSLYVGEFVNGLPEGNGICYYFNGDVYKGEWKNHSPNGNGSVTFANKTIASGIWENGILKKRNYEDQAQDQIAANQKENTNISQNNASEIYAVVVGVAAYNHMQSLKYTDDDAYQLYAFFKSPEGGAVPDNHISILIDDAATKKNIATEMGKIFSKADANDVIMLYLSGHGLEGSFVPSDFDGTSNLLSYEDISAILDSSPAKYKLCIADACHSGSMYSAKAPYMAGLQDFYEKVKVSKGGSAMITSSKKEEKSLESSGFRQGVFSHFFIRGLKGEANKDGDNIITLQEAYDFVFTNVTSYTQNAQTPSISGRYDGSMPLAMIRR